NNGSFTPAISADGSYVAFVTAATDLGTTDANGSLGDVYLFARATGALTLVSHSTAGPTTTGNDGSFRPSISADGAFAAFETNASARGPTHANGTAQDVYLFRRATGALPLVSPSTAGLTSTGNNPSSDHAISADGSYVAFGTQATDLGTADANGASTDVYL